jgi:hypothetical protein
MYSTNVDAFVRRAILLRRVVFWRERSVENYPTQVRIAKLCSKVERYGN